MIHVHAQSEPATFDAAVRQKGLAHLHRKHIDLNKPLPPKTEVTPYWRDCLDDLYTRYAGTCAFLAVFFERVTGGASVDHFIAKSRRAELIYEWNNYRLSCSIMNSRKRDCEDVLDPFEIETGWFRLELVSGRIYPNPRLRAIRKAAVQQTIDRLGLDDPGNREMRARHYGEYCRGLYTADFLEQRSPFVYFEAHRQGLL